MRDGKNVLFITLELYSKAVGVRFDANFTEIEIDKIRFHKKRVSDMLDELRQQNHYGNLEIKYFPTRSVTVSQLRAYYNQTKARGFHADLICLDYAGICKPSRQHKDAYRLEQTSIYEELRGWAGEIERPL